MFTAKKFLRPMHTRNRRKLKRGGPYYPGFGGNIGIGEVFPVKPPTGGFFPGFNPPMYVLETYGQYGDLYQTGGIKGDKWVSKVLIFEIWGKGGIIYARVQRV